MYEIEKKSATTINNHTNTMLVDNNHNNIDPQRASERREPCRSHASFYCYSVKCSFITVCTLCTPCTPCTLCTRYGRRITSHELSVVLTKNHRRAKFKMRAVNLLSVFISCQLYLICLSICQYIFNYYLI